MIRERNPRGCTMIGDKFLTKEELKYEYFKQGKAKVYKYFKVDVSDEINSSTIDTYIASLQAVKEKYPDHSFHCYSDWDNDICYIMEIHRIETDEEFEERLKVLYAEHLEHKERAKIYEQERQEKKSSKKTTQTRKEIGPGEHK